MLNGVMVALQILVLSVWVRVLVEQQKKVSSWGLSCCSYRLKPRFLLVTLAAIIAKAIVEPWLSDYQINGITL